MFRTKWLWVLVLVALLLVFVPNVALADEPDPPGGVVDSELIVSAPSSPDQSGVDAYYPDPGGGPGSTISRSMRLMTSPWSCRSGHPSNRALTSS